MIEYLFVFFTSLALLYYYLPRYISFSILPPILLHSVSEYRKLRWRVNFEEKLPTALLEVAISGARTEEDVYSVLCTIGYPKIYGKIPPGRKILLSARETLSPFVVKTLTIVVDAFRKGVDVSSFLRKIAEGVERILDVRREIVSALFLQKYVLLISSAFLVPFILATTHNFLFSFGAENEYVHAVDAAVPFHLFFLSLFTGAFVAVIEGTPKNVVIYAPFLVLSSFFVYSFFANI